MPMTFEIEFTSEAIDDLKSFRKHEQVEIIEAIEA
jgi:mRNA-degrading endonuclease RelE of RelBE toxin-antitoxin system